MLLEHKLSSFLVTVPTEFLKTCGALGCGGAEREGALAREARWPHHLPQHSRAPFAQRTPEFTPCQMHRWRQLRVGELFSRV